MQRGFLISVAVHHQPSVAAGGGVLNDVVGLARLVSQGPLGLYAGPGLDLCVAPPGLQPLLLLLRGAGVQVRACHSLK